MPMCPVCGNWYGRAEFSTCYSCAERARTALNRLSPLPSTPPADFVPATTVPVGDIMLEKAVESFLKLHYLDDDSRAKQALLDQLTAIGRGTCYECGLLSTGLAHYTVAHVARLFQVPTVPLVNRLVPLIEAALSLKQAAADNPKESAITSREPVIGWRAYSLTMDGQGPVLKGPKEVWPGPHFEALCQGKRELALTHIEAPLANGGDDSLGYDQETLLPLGYLIRRRSVCECGVYAMTTPEGIKANLVGGNLLTKVVAKAYGWGIVQMGQDESSWRASDVTIAELWLPIGVEMDGAPPATHGPFSIYSKDFDWDRLCQDVSDRYDCVVHLYYGGLLNKAFRHYYPPELPPPPPDESLNEEDPDVPGLPLWLTQGLKGGDA